MEKRKKQEDALPESIDKPFKTVDQDSQPTLKSSSSSSTNQVQNIVTKLKAVIDELAKNFADAKDLILELARVLDETKQCEQRNQICRKIKELLRDRIAEGKITEKWIEECLPQEYKRKYNNNIKSELSSLSGSREKNREGYDNDDSKPLEKILIDVCGQLSSIKEQLLSLQLNSSNSISNNNVKANESNSIATKNDKNNNNNTQNELDNQERSSSKAGYTGSRELLQGDRDDDDTAAVPKASSPLTCSSQIQQNCANKKHRVHRGKYNQLIEAMSKSRGFCFLTFDKDATLVLAEPDSRDEESRS